MTAFNDMLKKLTQKQIALARAFQEHGITSYSKAIKALYNGDDEKIAQWRSQLPKK